MDPRSTLQFTSDTRTNAHAPGHKPFQRTGGRSAHRIMTNVQQTSRGQVMCQRTSRDQMRRTCSKSPRLTHMSARCRRSPHTLRRSWPASPSRGLHHGTCACRAYTRMSVPATLKLRDTSCRSSGSTLPVDISRSRAWERDACKTVQARLHMRIVISSLCRG